MNTQTAYRLYRALVRARKFDEKVGELYPEQEIKCPVHLSLGEEGSSAGVCAALETRDTVWSGHRCHGPTVAKGAQFRPLFAEMYGKVTGCAKGKGGSMHFVAPEVGVMGASAILGASIPLALGSALASKLMGLDEVSVAFFGDGALEQGAFHESMNFASLHKLPVIFVATNNHIATATPLKDRQPHVELWRHGAQYAIPSFRIDGRKPQDVYERAVEAVKRARAGKGPTFFEVICERWSVHVLTNAAYVPVTDKEDPIRNFEKFARAKKLLSEKKIAAINEETDREIADALAFAQASPFPPLEEIYTDV